MVCAYLPNWWSRGPDNNPEGPRVTDVVASQMCEILSDILKLVTVSRSLRGKDDNINTATVV